ncbi:hypothetical protein [Okeania sp. SIO2B3]|uniref:hypothetical protein n=1 Tax=Okeania sp. SIO2B3 TaxID=2607784 RepID=UPI0013C04E4F|nr:hypothetical protein [Okeania sp. SIO2B3]NET41392.1 hypothetical protein [Okeania sp. SIO2B3]
MNQLPNSSNKSTIFGTNNTQEDKNILGDNNVQGNKNSVVNVNGKAIFNNSQSLDAQQQESAKVCRLKALKETDSKYDGELVLVELDFFLDAEEEEINQSQGIGIVLDISFGEYDEQIIESEC